MTIETNRMCISRDDNSVTNKCLPRQRPTTARNVIKLLSSTCVIRAVLSVSYLLVSYFVVNFLRRVFAVCHSFRSMYQSGRMKGFERCFKVEDQGTGTWRRQNLHAAIFCDRQRRGYKLTFMSAISSHLGKERSLRVLNELHLGKEKPVMGNIEPFLGIAKPAERLNKLCQGNVNVKKIFRR